MTKLRSLLAAGMRNGVSGLREVKGEEISELEPGLDLDGLVGGVFSEEEYVVDSFLLALSNLYEAMER